MSRIRFIISFLSVLMVIMVTIWSCGGGSGDSDETWYRDVDGDKYGDMNSDPIVQPERPPDHYLESELTESDTDCDDDDADINPGVTEICEDTVDQDCSGSDLLCAGTIPAGCFSMGDTSNDAGAEEHPVHTVCITETFYMDLYEVTNAEYAACVNAGACDPQSNNSSGSRVNYYDNPAFENFPVVYVNWNKANDYCSWAGKRLPTEAEWEYAARGGLEKARYPWGDTISGIDANYIDSGDVWDNNSTQVGSYAPNGYGLYDMAGNVREWVADWYSDSYYSASPTNDPTGPATGIVHVNRNGGFWDAVEALRVSHRSGYVYVPGYNSDSLGFRCASD